LEKDVPDKIGNLPLDIFHRAVLSRISLSDIPKHSRP